MINPIAWIKKRYVNFKNTHIMIRNFKECKRNKSIPIFRLKEYAALTKTAKPTEIKYIELVKSSIPIYYEFRISDTINLTIILTIVKYPAKTEPSYGITTGKIRNIIEYARIFYKKNSSPVPKGHKFYYTSSNSGELMYRSQIDINSLQNCSVTKFTKEFTDSMVELICDMVIDNLKHLEW